MKKRIVACMGVVTMVLSLLIGIGGTAQADNTDIIPARYDLRELELVSHVRNEGNYTVSWANAMVAAMESNAILNGYRDPNRAYTECNLSEYQIAYMSTNYMPEDATYVEGIIDKDEVVRTNNPDVYPWYSRNRFPGLVVAKFMQGYALMKEEKYPYSNIEEELPAAAVSINGDLYLDACYETNLINTEEVKRLIMKYGAVCAPICGKCFSDEVYGNVETWSIYLPNYTAKYSGPTRYAAIVGWDDDYSKENFKITPPGDGAWIVKNAWGVMYGDAGYFYISYYDAVFNDPTCNVYATEVTSGRKYDRIYQYDCGACAQYIEKVKDVVINFTSIRRETIDAVRISPYAIGETPIKAVINVYKGTFDGNETEDEPLYTTECEIEYSGYQTIYFDEEVALSPREEYYVRVTFDKPLNKYRVDGYLRCTEGNFYEGLAHGNPGETYVNVSKGDESDGWYDTHKTPFVNTSCNACIKVLTQNSAKTPADLYLERIQEKLGLRGACLVLVGLGAFACVVIELIKFIHKKK